VALTPKKQDSALLLEEMAALRKKDPEEFARRARELAAKSKSEASKLLWEALARGAENGMK
jgi:hypothetical protein